MVDYYRDVVALLRAAGCERRRPGKGSHEVWFSPLTGKPVIVPKSSKSRHTMNEVLKQAGLPKAF